MAPRYQRSNRTLAAIAGAGVLAVAMGAMVERAISQSGERVIKITAERYDYEPEHITLKRGEPVTLELTAEDRMHGFHVKALGVRADVIPGQSVRLHIVPKEVGTFPFTCDVFCGSGHGDMSGTITVVP